MSNTTTWVAPKSDALIAAYRIGDDNLHPFEAEQDDSQLSHALGTLEAWKASQSLEQAAVLVMKSETGTSLGIRNGGLIIEGQSKLNIGLMRASTRALEPVRPTLGAEPIIKSDITFHRTFWAVLRRLQGVALPRAMQFYFDGVEGQVYVDRGTLRFTGDFLNPADFVGELKAACDVDEEVRYTLADDQTPPDVPTFPISDLIAHVTEVSEDGSYSFAEDGWPIACGDLANLDLIQSLAAIAASGDQTSHHATPVSISILSDQNQPIVTGIRKQDGTTEFQVT